MRSRDCSSPYPSHGGKHCTGPSVSHEPCQLQPCPVDGGWSQWVEWGSCSTSCGSGLQERSRSCDSPTPQHGGRECVGRESQSQPCHLRNCPVDGSWGLWGDVSDCSATCGDQGIRTRGRLCDSPPPSEGGKYCEGEENLTEPCNRNISCPEDRSYWLEWGEWSDCSKSCGGGQRKRSRLCQEPSLTLAKTGCIGEGQRTENCNLNPCPVDGVWSAWSDWSPCSVTCDEGVRTRDRTCTGPFYQGKPCPGPAQQSSTCTVEPCKKGRKGEYSAVSSIAGTINSRNFGGATMYVNVTPTDRSASLVSASVHNMPFSIREYLRPVMTLLTPIYWTLSAERGHALNGLGLTSGTAKFKQQSHILFGTGEVLKLIHISRGLDHEGVLHLDTVTMGSVPELASPGTSIHSGAYSDVILLPFHEEFVQTGPSSLYGYSSQLIRVGPHSLPVALNHSVEYGEKSGPGKAGPQPSGQAGTGPRTMPHLVQRIQAEDLFVEVDVNNDILKYQMTTAMAKGEPSNECPQGFYLTTDNDSSYCLDIDECATVGTNTSPGERGSSGGPQCSHHCVNTQGAYQCSCPKGLSLAADGHMCLDVDECKLRLDGCDLWKQDCANTFSSHLCLPKCPTGSRRSQQQLQQLSSSSLTQQQLNQLIGSSSLTQQQLGNNRVTQQQLMSHSRQNSYQQKQQSEQLDQLINLNDTMKQLLQCEDIDECAEMRSGLSTGLAPCDHECVNTVGSYHCSCSLGFRLVLPASCVDINECRTVYHGCSQLCHNTHGSYSCSCHPGYTRSLLDPRVCIDVDECVMSHHTCKGQGQTCVNSQGRYQCTCTEGYQLITLPTSPHLKKSSLSNPASSFCADVDECSQLIGPCQHKCENLIGGYKCSCPMGYRLSQNNRTCLDIDECSENPHIDCGPEGRCFNRRGDFTCVDVTCPDNYYRHPVTKTCVLNCDRPASRGNPLCTTGSRHRQNLEFRLVALPQGIPAFRDLLRLVVYDQDQTILRNTNFSIISQRSLEDEQAGSPPRQVSQGVANQQQGNRGRRTSQSQLIQRREQYSYANYSYTRQNRYDDRSYRQNIGDQLRNQYRRKRRQALNGTLVKESNGNKTRTDNLLHTDQEKKESVIEPNQLRNGNNERQEIKDRKMKNAPTRIINEREDLNKGVKTGNSDAASTNREFYRKVRKHWRHEIRRQVRIRERATNTSETQWSLGAYVGVIWDKSDEMHERLHRRLEAELQKQNSEQNKISDQLMDQSRDNKVESNKRNQKSRERTRRQVTSGESLRLKTRRQVTSGESLRLKTRRQVTSGESLRLKTRRQVTSGESLRLKRIKRQASSGESLRLRRESEDAWFGIRVEEGRATVYALKDISNKKSFELRVVGVAYDQTGTNRIPLYHTTFIIYISVSAFPY